MAPPPARRWKSTASAEARGAPAGTGEAALPDAVGNLLQRSGVVGARIVFIGDQPIQRPVFGVCGKLRFMHYSGGVGGPSGFCNTASRRFPQPGASALESRPGK